MTRPVDLGGRPGTRNPSDPRLARISLKGKGMSNKSFRKQVAEKIESLQEEIASMRTAHDMVKTQAARDAIMAKIENAQSNLRRLRGF
jgi:hypothetical protein